MVAHAEEALAQLDIPGGTLDVNASIGLHERMPLEEARAPFGTEDPFRPAFPIAEGHQFAYGAHARFATAGPTRSDLRLGLDFGWLDAIRINDPDGAPAGRLAFPDGDGWFAVVRQEWLRAWRGRDLRWGVDARQLALLTLNGATQHGALVGGRNTLPGHPCHAWHAEQLLLVDAEAWITVVPRWLRLRARGWRRRRFGC